MSRNPSLQPAQNGVVEVPRTQLDAPCLDLARSATLENRDSLAAGLIQSRPEQASSTQTWIDNVQVYRFPLAVAVVAVHSGEFVATFTQRQSPTAAGIFSLWLVDFLTMIARLATPSFLLIAGLVFCKDGAVSHDQYRRKVKARLRTLLVPYLAWNFIAVLLFCLPSAFKYFVSTPETFTYTPLTLSGFVKWVVGWPVYPADAPLWFVRDLLLLIAMMPILNFVPRRAQLIGLGGLFIYWLLFPIDVIPGGIPRAFSVVFFMIGVGIAMYPACLRTIAEAKWLIHAIAAILLLSAAACANCGILGQDNSHLRLLLEKVVRVSGALLVVCAGIRVRLPAMLTAQLQRLSPVAFFLFASHYLAFVCIIPLFANGPLGRVHEVLLFGLITLTVITISLAAYFLLRRCAPSLLGILDGNRSARGSGNKRRGLQFDVERLSTSSIGAQPKLVKN